MNLKGLTIKQARKDIEQGEYNLGELYEAYKQNISRQNDKLNVYLEITTEMFDEIVGKLNNDKKLQAVSGLPFALKDNFNMTNTHTTASSRSLESYISPYNATVTQRLLDSQGIVLGKTNMDAFAHGSSTETSDFGTTLNPVDTSRSPGGSSGGSGAAVAADMALYAIGSETAGSVRGPAAWCGVVGFAPTYGRISRYGVIAMGSSLDRPGVLANSVEDCALVTDVIAGHDPLDATTIPEKSTNYSQKLKRIDGGITLGVPKQFLDDRIDPEVSAKAQEMLKELEQLGFRIKKLDLLDPKYSIATYTIIARSEISSNLARIDGLRYGYSSKEEANSVLEQIAQNRAESFGNEAKQRSMTGAYALSAGYYDAYYKKAQQVRTMIIEDFSKAFEDVDLIVGPTMPTVAPKVGASEDNPLFGELTDMLTEPSALAGLPCISIPVGNNSEGLPIGFQIFGPQFAEQKVLDLGFTLEQHLR